MMDTLWRAVSPRLPYSPSRRPLPRSHRGLRQRLDRRLVVRPWSSYLYISLSSSITLYLCLCSIAVTVTALQPIAVFSVKPTFLPQPVYVASGASSALLYLTVAKPNRSTLGQNH